MNLNQRSQLKTIEDLKNYLVNYFADKKVRVYLFGSRARGTNSPHSDVDLAIESKEDLSREVTLLRFILEESNLPYKVDLVVLSEVDAYMQEVIKKEGKIWIDTLYLKGSLNNS